MESCRFACVASGGVMRGAVQQEGDQRTDSGPPSCLVTVMNLSPSVFPAAQRGHRVLLCVDRSPASEACVPYAVWLAKTYGSAITIVHVLRPARARDGERGNDALGWEILRQEASGYLSRLGAEVSHAVGVPVETRLEQGRPAERIVDLAREVGADVTIIGSGGESELSASVLGSTAQHVLALARNSVFVANVSLRAAAVVAPKHMLVPLDGSLRAESVLPAAGMIAKAHGAEMLLVHVVSEPMATGLLDSVEGMDLARKLADYLQGRAESYLQRLRAQLELLEISVRTLVIRHVNERQCLLEIAQRERSDLAVLLAHGSACDSGRSFGSMTAHLLGHSTLPLLVLQDVPEGASRVHDHDDDAASLAPQSRRISYAPDHP